MKRWAAVLLLVVVATFLAAAREDHCHDDADAHSPQSQHLLCIDNCTPAMIPQAPAPPPADALPKASYIETLSPPILNLDLEPEKSPPRT